MEMRKVWVEDCSLPGIVYDKAFAHMPEPTESKWQVMYQVCFSLMQIFDVNVQHRGFRASMIEEFINKLFDYVRGTADKVCARARVRVRVRARARVRVRMGLFSKPSTLSHAQARPQDAGKHACRQKLVTIGGLIRNLELPAAIHLIVDYHEQNAVRFNKVRRIHQ